MQNKDKKYINVRSVSFWGAIVSGLGAALIVLEPAFPGAAVIGKALIAFGAPIFGIGMRAAIK